MLQMILWKEYREQRTTWLALAAVMAALVLGVGYGVGLEGSDTAPRDFLGIGVLALSWTYGAVCGAVLLAGERESGTQPFLDALPMGRVVLWWRKLAAGALFVLAQVAVTVALGVWVGLAAQVGVVLGTALVLASAAAGFGWGMLGSSLTRAPLTAVAMAVVCQIGVGPVLTLAVNVLAAVALWMLGLSREGTQLVALALAVAVNGLLPLPVSALLYAHQDLRRNRPAPMEQGPATWQALWLAWAQSRGLTVLVMILSVLCGILAAMNVVAVWPVASLVLGVICGATTFLDEQEGARRFLGEQRLPLTRLWLAKVAVRLGVLALGLVLLAIPVLVRAASQGQEEAWPFGTTPAFFLTWAAYGFGVSHLCGVLFRKALVAVVVSLGLSALASIVWLPSMLLGGLHLWQVLAVPLVLVLATRWLLRLWVTDRIASWAAAWRLIVTVAACVALTGLGVWARVAEIADVKPPPEFDAYVAALPGDDEAGRVGRDALAVLRRQNKGWHPLPDQDDEAATDRWLDKVFADPVWARFERLRDLPPGVIDDPRRMTLTSPRFQEEAPFAAHCLALRGLQLQKRGRPEAFVVNLETSLALARDVDARTAADVERGRMTLLMRWLEGLGDDGPLLRRALAALQKHRDLVAATPDARFPAYLILRNSHFGRPSERLVSDLPLAGQEAEPALLETVASLPWERARLERQFHQQFWTDPPRTTNQARRWCLLDGMTQVVALRLYQAEKGKTAPELAALVPDYLPALPRDPFGNGPFGYRVSKGEEIELPAAEGGAAGAAGGGAPALPVMPPQRRGLRVRAGQGVLSAGDEVFVVPLARK